MPAQPARIRALAERFADLQQRGAPAQQEQQMMPAAPPGEMAIADRLSRLDDRLHAPVVAHAPLARVVQPARHVEMPF